MAKKKINVLTSWRVIKFLKVEVWKVDGRGGCSERVLRVPTFVNPEPLFLLLRDIGVWARRGL
jgi:hypothetical protein